jgi:hypothetical protein
LVISVVYFGYAYYHPIHQEIYDDNWAGAVTSFRSWEAGNNQPIYEVSASITVPVASMPPATQTDSNVDQVLSSWIGLSVIANGTDGLAQTGFSVNVDGNGPYLLWYMVFPFERAEIFYLNNDIPATVSTGEKVNFTIVNFGGYWEFEASISNGLSYKAIDNHGFTAYYAELITEAYATSNGTVDLTQQICKFSKVYFYSAKIYSMGSVHNFYLQDFILLDMNQTNMKNADVKTIYSSTYVETIWQNSYYNYTFVNDHLN